MKETKPKPLDINPRPDRERRATQAQRLARVLNVLQLIQSATKYDAKALAEQLGCCERTIARDLQTLKCAGVPCYFDQQLGAYRLLSNYRSPTQFDHANAKQIPQDAEPIRHSHYIKYFRMDDPMSNQEIQFVARWLHESHNLGSYTGITFIKWNQKWNMPEVALANFYTVFMNAFKGDTAAFFDLVVSQSAVPMGVPWKSEVEFHSRDQAVCDWLRKHNVGSVIDIREQIKKYRSCQQ